MSTPNETLSEINAQFINQLVDRCNEVGVENVLKELADILAKQRLNKEQLTKTEDEKVEKLAENMSVAIVFGILFYALSWLIGPSINNLLIDRNKVQDAQIYFFGLISILGLLIHEYPQQTLEIIYKFSGKDKLLISGQGNLIKKIIEFSKNAKIDDELVLPLFSNSMDLISNNDGSKLDGLRKGICLGLDSLFLFSSFISDMQDESQEQEPRDDLRWFYKCITLLQFPTEILSSEQKHELARFISIVIHLQNTVVFTNLYDENDSNNNIKTKWYHNISAFNIVLTTPVQDAKKTENKPPTAEKPSQDTHMLNLETTGKHYIDFGGTRQFQTPEELIVALNNSNSPLYIEIDLALKDGGHAVGLHKNKNGVITYYDPNFGFATVKLSSIEDLEKFVQDHINKYQLRPQTYLYKADDTREFLVNAFFTIGTPKLKPNRSLKI
jgi:hypothetical protein